MRINPVFGLPENKQSILPQRLRKDAHILNYMKFSIVLVLTF